MRCRVWVRDILFAVRQLNCRQSPTVFPRLCCSKEYHILCHWILSNPPRREFRKTSGNRNAIGRNSFLGDVHYTPFVHYGGRAARKVPTRPPFVPGRSESFLAIFRSSTGSRKKSRNSRRPGHLPKNGTFGTSARNWLTIGTLAVTSGAKPNVSKMFQIWHYCECRLV